MSGKVGGGGGGSDNKNNNNNINGKGNNGITAGMIPAGSRKMVQSLKEIVNYPDAEIYAMLQDCNMDPNETVNRLLSLDPFHEVKSKREKKKENKDTDPRSRGGSNMALRSGKGGTDRYGRTGSTQFGYNESATLPGKPANKKENATHSYTGSSSAASGLPGHSINRQLPSHSDSGATKIKISPVDAADGVLSSSQHSSGFQSAWLGVPGQVSMADIVKMGRHHKKASVMTPQPSVGHHHGLAPSLGASHHDSHLSEYNALKVLEINAEPEGTASHHVHSIDEWPSIEHTPAASVSTILEVPPNSELYVEPSNLPLEGGSQHVKSQLDDVESSEDGHIESLNDNHVGPASVSSRSIQEDGSGGASLFDNNLYENMNSYQPYRHAFEHNADEENGASSVAAKLQQLNLQNNHQGTTLEDDNPSVIIPNHLQVHAQDCSHLSFGSFGTGISSAFSEAFASRTLKDNLEEENDAVEALPAVHTDARNPEYYGDEHIRSSADENLTPRVGVSSGNYDSSSVPQPEVLEEIPEAAQGNQYTFPSSARGYSYENDQPLSAAFSEAETSSQMQNISPFSSEMQAYSNSLPSNLLASTVLPGREPDLPYSPFPVTQLMTTKYSNTSSSISGSSIPMPEALRAGTISTPLPTSQTLPGAASVAAAIPQHLAVHPYSQPSLPLGHFANMIGYPYLPQSYPFMPSAFQQTFAGNNTYHQSLAAVLPQYKNSVSVSSLPQSAAVAAGYGFGSSTNMPPGSFPLNPPTAPAGTTLGYDDVLSTQYKDGSHLISLQQNENSAMWVHGPGSRSMSAVPASTYYNFQGQNQQPGGFRQQGQQPSQQFGALGYPNYYHSQSGMSLEHQLQSSRDGSLSGSQGQPSKHTQQLWQNSY